MESMLNYAHKIGLKIVPIINVLNNDNFLEVISKHSKLLTNGVLLHLKSKDFVNIENIISKITRKSSFKKEDIILLFDFFIVDSNISPETYSDIAINAISKIDIKEYKSVVFSASSFPAEISGLEAYILVKNICSHSSH